VQGSDEVLLVKAKLEVNFTFVKATKAQSGSRDTALLSLTSTPRPGSFASVKIRCLLYRRIGVPQGQSGQMQKISSHLGFDPRTVKSVASSSTD
jgi:hypothetical protein